MIYNIYHHTFSTMRMGDLVAVCNVVEWFRHYTKGTKFHLKPGCLDGSEHTQKFFNHLKETTDYFSDEPGTDLSWRRVNLWDFRAKTGDVVQFKNTDEFVKKIVICPVFDATYNTYRNWPRDTFSAYLDQYSYGLYDGSERVICVRHKDVLPPGDYSHWNISTDFLENLKHIRTANIFVGGDTGTSHYAWALDRSPSTLIYVNSGRGLLHTTPFYLIQGKKGHMEPYWLDFEGTTWE